MSINTNQVEDKRYATIIRKLNYSMFFPIYLYDKHDKHKMKYLIFIIILLLVVIAAYTYNNTQNTKVVSTTRGLYTSSPVLKGVIPPVLSGLKFIINGDTLGNDLSGTTLNNITLTQAAAQIPTDAVGFTFLVTDGALVSATSVGNAFYKTAIDFNPSNEFSTYRRVQGKETFEMISNFDVFGNDMGGGPGDVAAAIVACQSNSLCDGFTSTGTTFGLKTNITPYSIYDWASFTYARSTYTLPSHTWTPVSVT